MYMLLHAMRRDEETPCVLACLLACVVNTRAPFAFRTAGKR